MRCCYQMRSEISNSRRMTFWLPEDMIAGIKGLASKQGRTASAILREILREYLKNK